MAMSQQKEENLKSLLGDVPLGTIFDAACLSCYKILYKNAFCPRFCNKRSIPYETKFCRIISGW